MVARSVASMPFVRLQIDRLRHGPRPVATSDRAQGAAVLLAVTACLVDAHVLTAMVIVAVMAGLHLVWIRRAPRPARVLGLREPRWAQVWCSALHWGYCSDDHGRRNGDDDDRPVPHPRRARPRLTVTRCGARSARARLLLRRESLPGPSVRACRARCLDVVARLSIVPPRAPAPWASLGPAELVDHIEATHHAYLWQELPRLTELADKVARVHGHRHPELADVVAVVGQLRADLEPHLLKEERVLFPRIRRLVAVVGTPTFECGDLRNPISVMLTEHERVGTLLTRTVKLPATSPSHPTAVPATPPSTTALPRRDRHSPPRPQGEQLLFPAVVDLEAGRSRQH